MKKLLFVLITLASVASYGQTGGFDQLSVYKRIYFPGNKKIVGAASSVTDSEDSIPTAKAVKDFVTLSSTAKTWQETLLAGSTLTSSHTVTFAPTAGFGDMRFTTAQPLSQFTFDHTGAGTALVVSSNNNTFGSTGFLAINSTGNIAATAATYNSTNNTILPSLVIGRTSNLTPAAGIGSAIDFHLGTSTIGAGSLVHRAARFAAKWTNTAYSTRTSQVEISNLNSGTESNVMEINGPGQVRYNKYGTGTFTGTPVYGAAFTSIGQVVEIPLSSGGTPGGSSNAIQYNNGGSFGGLGSYNSGTKIVDWDANSFDNVKEIWAYHGGSQFHYDPANGLFTVTFNGGDDYIQYYADTHTFSGYFNDSQNFNFSPDGFRFNNAPILNNEDSVLNKTRVQELIAEAMSRKIITSSYTQTFTASGTYTFSPGVITTLKMDGNDDVTVSFSDLHDGDYFELVTVRTGGTGNFLLASTVIDPTNGATIERFETDHSYTLRFSQAEDKLYLISSR